jgi:hypothetical protein
LDGDEMPIKTYIQMEGEEIIEVELNVDELLDVTLGINYAQLEGFDLNVDLHSVDVDDVAPPIVKLSDAKRHASLLSRLVLVSLNYLDHFSILARVTSVNHTHSIMRRVALHTVDLLAHRWGTNPPTLAIGTLPLIGNQRLIVDFKLIIALPEQQYNNPNYAKQLCPHIQPMPVVVERGVRFRKAPGFWLQLVSLAGSSNL